MRNIKFMTLVGAAVLLTGGTFLVHAEDFPPAGLTTFLAPGPPSYISATVFLPGDTLVIIQARRVASITINRGDPFDPGDGLREIPAEIIAVSGHGFDSLLGDFYGQESPDFNSVGLIKALSPHADFPAESYFDVFAILEFPDLGITVFNKDPLRIEAVIFDIPPIGDPFSSSPYDSVLLYDYNDPSTEVGWLTDVYVYPATVVPIPTLTEWGLIIFCALLFGWMAWMVVRRKRTVTAGI